MEDLWGFMLENYYRKYGETSGFPAEEDQFFYMEREDDFVIKQSIYVFFTKKFNEWSFAERAAVKRAYGTVLDVGCGSGRMSLYLQEQGLQVKAIDFSQRCVDICKSRGVIDVELQDVYEMSYPENSFDTILISGTGGLIPNISHIKKLLDKILFVLKPSGQIIGSSCYWTPDPTQDEYKRLHGVLVKGRLKYLDYIGEWEESLQFDISEWEGKLPRKLVMTDLFESGNENLTYVQWSFIIKGRT